MPRKWTHCEHGKRSGRVCQSCWDAHLPKSIPIARFSSLMSLHKPAVDRRDHEWEARARVMPPVDKHLKKIEPGPVAPEDIPPVFL